MFQKRKWFPLVLAHLFFVDTQARVVADTFPKKMLPPDNKRNNVLPSPAQPVPAQEKFVFTSREANNPSIVLVKNMALTPSRSIPPQTIGSPIPHKEPAAGKHKETPP